MSFWDRFVWGICFGLGQSTPVARAAAVRIAEVALSRNALLAALNDASLLQLLALLPATSLARADVQVEAQTRGLLDPARLLAASQTSTPSRLIWRTARCAGWHWGRFAPLSRTILVLIRPKMCSMTFL